MFFSLFIPLVLLVLLDQWTKYFFSQFLWENRIQIFSDYLMLSFVHNTGIAFSFPLEGIVLKIITIVLIAGISLYFFRYERHREFPMVKIAYALILSGAISNGIERVFYGSVIDFIAVKYFAILNFADIFISIGVFLLFIIYFKYERAAWTNK